MKEAFIELNGRLEAGEDQKSCKRNRRREGNAKNRQEEDSLQHVQTTLAWHLLNLDAFVLANRIQTWPVIFHRSIAVQHRASIS